MLEIKAVQEAWVAAGSRVAQQFCNTAPVSTVKHLMMPRVLLSDAGSSSPFVISVMLMFGNIRPFTLAVG